MEKKKMTLEERYADEMLSDNASLDKYQQCKTCIFRDMTKVQGEECGYCKGNCDMFPYPEFKPDDVMRNRTMCEFYEKYKN